MSELAEVMSDLADKAAVVRFRRTRDGKCIIVTGRMLEIGQSQQVSAEYDEGTALKALKKIADATLDMRTMGPANTLDRWVHISLGLPPKWTWCFVTNGDMDWVAAWDGERWWHNELYDDNPHVIAWMMIPDPPKYSPETCIGYRE